MALKKSAMESVRELVMAVVRELVMGIFLVVAMVLVQELMAQALDLVTGRFQNVT
jgi:hypothetical protein